MRTFHLICLFFMAYGLVSGEVIEVRSLILPADNIKSLQINCGAGSLKIDGSETASEIKAEAQILIKNATSEECARILQDNMDLSLSASDSLAVLNSFVERSPEFSDRNICITINLTITLPANIRLDIDDGAGAIVIDNMKNGIKLEDGSGSIDITNVSGPLKLEDHSGYIRLENVFGNVEVRDGSVLLNQRHGRLWAYPRNPGNIIRSVS